MATPNSFYGTVKQVARAYTPAIDGKAVYGATAAAAMNVNKYAASCVQSMDMQAMYETTKQIAQNPTVQNVAIGTAVGVGVVVAAPVVLGAVGFTAAGVQAGTVAAAWQSTIGNVAAGSAFAMLQSAGAAGLGVSSVTTGAIGGAVAATYSAFTKPGK